MFYLLRKKNILRLLKLNKFAVVRIKANLRSPVVWSTVKLVARIWGYGGGIPPMLAFD